MPFANVERRTKDNSFKKITYFEMVQGQHTIRLLTNNATEAFAHWVGKGNIACLGDECPICKNNKKIIMENPDSFRNIKGWNPSRKIFFVNILDKTPVKVCPSCGKENKKLGTMFPAKCSGCDNFLNTVTPRPSNTVKVLSRGVQLFEQFVQGEQGVLDEQGTVVPITNYDWTLIVTGQGTTMTAVVVPQDGTISEAPEGLELYDLSAPVVTLTAEEMLEALRGVSIKDIFSARKATSTDDETTEELPATEAATADIQASLSKLFKSK